MSLNKNIIKKIAICVLEQLANESDLEFADSNGNYYKFANNVQPELLQDLLNANVHFFSDSDTIGCLYPSNVPIKKLFEFAEDHPGCVFSTVLAYDENFNLVKLFVDGLANYCDTSEEFAYALATVAPPNSIILFEDGCVSAYMDLPHTS